MKRWWRWLRRGRHSIRTQLMAFTLAVAAPLLLLVAFGVQVLSTEAARHARSASEVIARDVARDVAVQIERLATMLDRLAERPRVRALDPANCDPVLPEMAALEPLVLDMVTFRADGTVVCAARDATGVRVVDEAAGAGRRPSNVLWGAFSRRHVAVISEQLRSPGGEAGSFAFVLDLESLSPPIDRGMPPGTAIYVVDGAGLVVTAAGSPHAIGRRASELGLPGGRGEALVAAEVEGPGGKRLVVTGVPIDGTAWTAIAAIPPEFASAAARRLTVRSALAAAVALAAMFFAAMRLGARIANPIAALAATVRASRSGDASARAPVGGPREIAEVARELNAALDARQETERAQTAAAAERELRAAWEGLQAATSRRLLAAAPDALVAELAPALERFRAFLELDAVALYEIEDDEARVVASARRERFPAEALEFRFPARECPVGFETVRRGEPFSFERLEALEREAPGDAEAFRRRGIRALLAQPLLAHGVSSGALAFFSTEVLAWPDDLLRRTRVAAELFAHVLARIRSERAVRQSEERYRKLFDAAGDGIFVTDLHHGTVVAANRRAAEMTGRDPAALLGMAVLDLVPEADRAFVEREYRTHAEGAGAAGRRTLARFERPDGTLVPFEIASTFFLEDGQVRILWIARDLSDQQRAEADRRRLEAQFLQAQKLEAVGRLAGGVAHDFNNLLSVILSYAEMLQRELPEENSYREDVQEIVGAARAGANLTRQLLAFSRRQAATPRVVRLGELVTGAQKLLERLIGEDIALEVTGRDQPALVRVDPGHLEQVLLNLAVNARDAMPGGGRLAIDVGTRVSETPFDDDGERIPPGRWVTLTVTDTGCGMDEETRAQVFEPFFTTKEPGKGSGLGLATVYGIVQQAGGHVAVESAPGQGATFRIYLPEVDGDAAEDDDAAGTEPAAVPPMVVNQATILVVEDDDALRHLMQRVLTGAGYHVLAAGSGDEAIRAAAAHRAPIHLLLSDVVMPGMDGRELSLSLRAGRPELRTLFVSGYTDDILGQHGVLAPGTHLLHKPFTHPQLVDAVHRMLELQAQAPGGIPH